MQNTRLSEKGEINMTNNMNEMYKGENNMNTKETMINKAVFREIEGENKITEKQTSRMNKLTI